MLLTMIAQDSTGNPAGGLVIFLPLIAVFYFFMIRPQRQRMRQHQELISSVAVGDEIETVAGMYGTIRRMEDGVVHVEISPGTTIKMSRNAIRRKIVEETTGGTTG